MRGFSRVLVTGGAGFLGSHLVDRLLGMKCFVRVVDNLSSGCLENLNGWRGDVKTMFLSSNKLLSLGWSPALGSGEAVRLGCREFLRFMKGR